MPPVVDETSGLNSMLDPVQASELNRMLQAVQAIDSTVVSLMAIRKTGIAALVNAQRDLASPGSQPVVWPRGGRW